MPIELILSLNAGSELRGIEYLPDHPIKVGESWDVDPSGYDKEDGKVTGKATLVSVDSVLGVKIAKIKETLDVVSAMEKQHYETTVLVDIATGKLISASLKTTLKGNEGNANAEMTLRRIVPGEKSEGKEAPKATTAAKKP